MKASKDILRSSIRKEIRDGLFAKFNADQLFLMEQEQIGRRGQSPSTKAALLKHYVRSANAAIEKVATPILKAHGAERVKASQAQAAKIAAQVAASKTEPRGSAAVSLPTTPKIDQAALTQQAVKELMAETRRMPSSAGKLEDYGKTMAAEQPEMWGKTRWRNNWRTDCFERFRRTSSSTK